MRRVISLWLPRLATDRITRAAPILHNKPFALVTERHGQAILFATNAIAEQEGLNPGMKLADARAIFPKLSVEPTQIQKDKAMLEKIRIWY